MRVTCERCLRRYDVPDATVKGRKIRARCKCGARVVVQDEERAARSSSGGSQTTGSIHRPVRWFVDITSWEPIAMDLRQLVRAFDGGRIDADTLVWRKGMPDWRRLRDVSELAERLMGADAAAKAAAPEVSVDPVATEAETPPRPAERSKTPPASYSVGDRASAALAQELQQSVAQQSVAQQSVASSVAPSEPAATLPGGSSVPPPPVKSYSTTPPRARERASLPGGRAVPMPNGAAPVRTITQTGLAPADPSARASAIPSEARATEGDAEAGRVGTPAGAANNRSRDSRVPTPAGGQRRARSNDETPAQKPSSISVPPGSMSQSPPRPRARHVAAVAVLVLGLGFLARGTLSTEDTGSTSAAATVESHPKPAVPAEPQHREERAPALPITEPAKFDPDPSAPVLVPTPAPAAPSAPKAAERLQSTPAVAKPAVAPASVLAQPQKPPAVTPAVTPPVAADLKPRLDVRPSLPASTEPGPLPSRTVIGRAEPVPTAPAAPSTEPPAPEPPAAKPPAAAPPATSPAAPPPAVGDAPAVPSTVPAAFDEKLARQQMSVAAFKASTCGQLGGTRGAGEVRVVIESWGRVVRVTHLNQAFVGTPVGLCVMQAFQQVQVPPFQGSPQSVSGSFQIQ